MEKYYNKIIIKEDIKNVKLDIGLSYNAPQSQNWLKNEPNLLVIGFEPNPEFLQSILSNEIIKKRDNNHGEPINNKYINERFFLFPIALSNVIEPTEMIFYKTIEDCGTSSLFKPIDDSLGKYEIVKSVPVYSLKHFFDLFPWDRFEYIDYIKIDAQGSDLDIIKSAGDYLKEKVVFITAEPEFCKYKDCQNNTTENMIEYLNSQGFISINHPNTFDPTFLNKKFKHLYEKIYIKQL
jgi:hypothetical protein